MVQRILAADAVRVVAASVHAAAAAAVEQHIAVVKKDGPGCVLLACCCQLGAGDVYDDAAGQPWYLQHTRELTSVIESGQAAMAAICGSSSSKWTTAG
jgi:hypothetical protein